jgi:5'-AMP-activated protein kinase catalytic alpha subunit
MKEIKEDEENTYLIMEFCEKGELFNYIVDKQKLEEWEAAYFYYQLINGLECIHYNGVVHRDLKPENLLISKGKILKIIDFGLSNYFDKIHLLSTPCGSPCYASPEMVSGRKYEGFLIDIWSTGIILFAMLCGYLPFEDPDNEILFKKIYQCDVEYPDDLSDDSVDLMNKILVNDPEERITIPDIKEHPFYLKGKRKFKAQHPDLVKEVEIDYAKIEKQKEKEKNKNIKIEEPKLIELINDKENKDNKDNKEIEDIKSNKENKEIQNKQNSENIINDKEVNNNNNDKIKIEEFNNESNNEDKDKDYNEDKDSNIDKDNNIENKDNINDKDNNKNKENIKEIIIANEEKDSDLKEKEQNKQNKESIEEIIDKKEENNNNNNIDSEKENNNANNNNNNNIKEKENE